MSDPALVQLNMAIRQALPVWRDLVATQKAALQQFYTLDDLAGRYRMGRDSVRALLVQYRMITPARGQSIRVRLDDVLRLDGILKSADGAQDLDKV